MLKINQLDLKKQYGSPEQELKATKSYIYQLVEELRYRFDDQEEPVEPGRTEEEVIGEAVRASYKYIDAKGVSADWINTGILKDSNSNFYFNLDTGVLRTNGLNLQLSDHDNQTLSEYIEAVKEDLEGQIDGNVTQWFENYEPTMANEPAHSWVQADIAAGNDDVKNHHLSDLFYDTTTGYSYRFVLEGTTYKWARISDSDITRALEAAARAQDTADGKRRVFVTQPTPPYDAGDLWTDGNDIYRCAQTRASGSYISSDWEMATSYRADINGLGSRITALPGSITSEVWEYYDGNRIASLINQNSTTVSISASKILLTAETIADKINQASSSVIIGAGHLDISSKADVSTVNGLATTVGQHETRISTNASNITLKANKTDFDSNGNVGTWVSKINQSAASITSTVKEFTDKFGTVKAAVSQIKQNADNIALKVSVGDVVNQINLDSSGAKIQASHINLTGYVTVNSLKSGGTTAIDGSRITTGTISADRIAANSIGVGKLTGTISNSGWSINLNAGTLTIGNISAAKITSGTLDAARIAADSISVSKLTGTIQDSGKTWSIDLKAGTLTIGNISANKITTGTLSATRVSGGTLSGSDISIGGSSNRYGELTVYGDGNSKELVLNYNGSQHYRSNKFIGKIGTNLYPGGETWLAADIRTANCWGFEITNDTAANHTAYRFSYDASQGFIGYDYNNNVLYSLSSKGLQIFNSNVNTTWIDKSAIWLANTSGTTQITLTGSSGAIVCKSLTQTSVAEAKKDITAIPHRATDLLMNTDIYQYILKCDDTDRKRYGVIIDGDYNCCDEIKDEDGVDIYSMVSVLWQAVKEQQAEISRLKGEK